MSTLQVTTAQRTWQHAVNSTAAGGTAASTPGAIWAWLQQSTRGKTSMTKGGLKSYKPVTAGADRQLILAPVLNLCLQRSPYSSGAGSGTSSPLTPRCLNEPSEVLAKAHATCAAVRNAGLRGRVTTSREGLHRGGPYKPLTTGKRSTGGRNSTGT